MRLVGRQVVIDQHRRRRMVEVRLDVVVAGDPIQLGDIQRTVMERDAVWPIQPLGDHLHGRFRPIGARHHRIHLVQQPVADEHRPRRRNRQRTRIRHPGRIRLDLEPGRHLELAGRHVGRRSRQRRRIDRRQRVALRTVEQRVAARIWHRQPRPARLRRLLRQLRHRCSSQQTHGERSARSGEHCFLQLHHDLPIYFRL